FLLLCLKSERGVEVVPTSVPVRAVPTAGPDIGTGDLQGRFPCAAGCLRQGHHGVVHPDRHVTVGRVPRILSELAYVVGDTLDGAFLVVVDSSGPGQDL